MAAEFNELLVNRPTPWAACTALEDFFTQGGKCRVEDKTNWRGIVFTCTMNADSADTTSSGTDVFVALGWSHLAIAITESLASNFSREESVGIITGAMWVRAKMIVRCGNHQGDHICDCDKLVAWCINLPSVLQALQIEKIPPILYVNPEARSVAEILAYLIEKGRLERIGDVARLLKLIMVAKQKSREI